MPLCYILLNLVQEMIRRFVRDRLCKPSIYESCFTSELRVRLVQCNCFFVDFFVICVCLCYTVMFASCSLKVTCETVSFVDLSRYLCLSLPYSDICFLQPCGHPCDVFLCFCHFPIRCPGSGVVLDCTNLYSLYSFILSICSLVHEISYTQ